MVSLKNTRGDHWVGVLNRAHSSFNTICSLALVQQGLLDEISIYSMTAHPPHNNEQERKGKLQITNLLRM
jgi:hypothetical protein